MAKQATPRLLADWATLLYTGYQQASNDYRRDPSATNCQICTGFVIVQQNLAAAVAELLPALWPSLRLVHPRALWHADPGFDWDAAESELRRIEAAARAAEAKPAKPIAKTNKLAKRSWTQLELDAAIRGEIEKHADLIAAATKGKAGAKKEVHKLFGRNAVAKRLGVKSARMVSDSAPWQALAKDVGLPRKSLRGSKVGLAMALEQVADADNSDVVADAIRRETEGMIDAAIRAATNKTDRQSFEALLQDYRDGKQTDDQARGIVGTLLGD